MGSPFFAAALRRLAPLALLVCAGCERADAPTETRVEVFDFEARAWPLSGVRSAEDPREGEYCLRVDGSGVPAFALGPLVECDGARFLSVAGWLCLDELGNGQADLFAHFYADAPSEHPAIPSVPKRLRSSILLRETEAAPGWHRYEESLDLTRFGEPTHLRLEARVRSSERKRERASVVRFDEITLTLRGSS